MNRRRIVLTESTEFGTSQHVDSLPYKDFFPEGWTITRKDIKQLWEEQQNSIESWARKIIGVDIETYQRMELGIYSKYTLSNKWTEVSEFNICFTPPRWLDDVNIDISFLEDLKNARR